MVQLSLHVHLRTHACKILFPFQIEINLCAILSHIWHVHYIGVNCYFFITLGNNQVVVNNRQCKGLYSFVNFKASAVCFTNPLITGRYVGISTVREQFLQLCEVEIYLRGTYH